MRESLRGSARGSPRTQGAPERTAPDISPALGPPSASGTLGEWNSLSQAPGPAHLCPRASRGDSERKAVHSRRQGAASRPVSVFSGRLRRAPPARSPLRQLFGVGFQIMASQRSALDAVLEGTGVNALDSSKSQTVTRGVSSNLQPQQTLRTFETKRHGMLPFEDTEVVCTVKKHEANDRSL